MVAHLFPANQLILMQNAHKTLIHVKLGSQDHDIAIHISNSAKPRHLVIHFDVTQQTTKQISQRLKMILGDRAQISARVSSAEYPVDPNRRPLISQPEQNTQLQGLDIWPNVPKFIRKTPAG